MDYKSLAVVGGLSFVVALAAIYAVNHVDSLGDLVKG